MKNKSSSSIKMPPMTLRTSLSKSEPESSMIKRVGGKKDPMLTTDASMPKNKKMKLPKRAK